MTVVRKPPGEVGKDALAAVRREAARRLVHRWLEEDSGYDKAVWPKVKKAIQENRLSERGRFGD